ncbi:MAG: FkbM family methyltransferase [Clostridia bacterium]|nr:FkbM family methyltransferase [Clostridia bacterium]
MINYRNIIFNDFKLDVWNTLQSSSLPILIYGMGNGADKIIDVFSAYGIEYQDIFASDGFVRGHSYKGKRVLSYSEALEKYPNGFDIVVSFGSKLPDVINKIYSLEKNHNVYAPDVPICGDNIFNTAFFEGHAEEIYTARTYLHDEISKAVYDNIIRYKLSGKLCYLKKTAFDTTECDALLNIHKYDSYADLGAYNGDTIKKYIDLCPNIKLIHAFEPDKRNFKKLSQFCDNLSDIEINLLNCAVYNSNTTLSFSSSGNRNSSATATQSFQNKEMLIEAHSLDSITKKASLIKYDVEGLEYEAILGSEKLIKQGSDLIVSLYHKSEDIFKLPILVNSLNPSAKLFIRRLPYIPAWDLNLYVIN